MNVMLDKRELLLEAAIELFGENGFWNTSTASVAQKAGVATGTLFDHFKSKDELIDEVMTYLKREMITESKKGIDPESDLRDQFEALWYNGMNWGLKFPHRFRLMEQIQIAQLLGQNMQKAIVGAPLEEVLSLIVAGVEQGIIQPLDPNLIAEIMFRNAQSYFEFLQAHPEMSRFEKNAHLEAGFELFWKSLTLPPKHQ